MNTITKDFKLKTVAALIFCSYFYWDFFYIEITLRYGASAMYAKEGTYEKLPLHRVFLALTFIIFLFNFRPIVQSINKNKSLLILIVYVLLSAIWSYNSIAAIKTFAFLLSIYFISIAVSLAFKDDKTPLIRYLFWMFFLLVSASIILALKYPEYGIDRYRYGSGPRWIGVTSHPNKLGSLCLASTWISISLFYLSKSFFEKFITIISIICALYTVKGADSMTSMFASLAVLGYSIYNYWIGTKSLSVRLIFLGASTLAFLAVTTLYMSTGDIVHTTLKSSGRNATLTGRTLQWAAAFESIKEHPLLGQGFDDLKPLTQKTHMDMSYIHSGYIAILVRGGTIAGIIFTLILIKTFLKQLSFRKSDPQSFTFLNAGLAGILIHNMAESTILIDLSGLNILLFFILILSNEINSSSLSTQKSNDKKPASFPNILGSYSPQVVIVE